MIRNPIMTRSPKRRKTSFCTFQLLHVITIRLIYHPHSCIKNTILVPTDYHIFRETPMLPSVLKQLNFITIDIISVKRKKWIKLRTLHILIFNKRFCRFHYCIPFHHIIIQTGQSLQIRREVSPILF